MQRYFKLIALLFLITSVFLLTSCEYKIEQSKQENGDLAILYIVSYDGESESKNLIKSLGHTFLVLENISLNNIEVYNYILNPGECVTFSWWAIDKHMGIWFNIEYYYIENYNKYDDRYSISQYINETDLQNISTYMENSDKYNPIDNCAKRCVDVWNICASDNEKIKGSLINNPSNVCDKIRTTNYFEYKIDINVLGSICYYDNSFGKKSFIAFEMEKLNEKKN